MPLAGKVKLKHFLLTLGIGCGVPFALSWLGCMSCVFCGAPSNPLSEDNTKDNGVMKQPEQIAVAQNNYQTVVASYAQKTITEKKKKDVRPDSSYKINIYQDDGHTTVNRAKVDIDRDDKWDEKWTFKDDGSITRDISSKDDEQYDVTSSWPESKAKDSSTRTSQKQKTTCADQAFSWKGKNIGGKKKKDVTKGQKCKINLYQDTGTSSVNRLKIDLDRDDKWDEKWTFKDDGSITRKVASKDDEQYDIEQAWSGSEWK